MDFVKEALKQNKQWESGVVEFARLSAPFVEREVFPALVLSSKSKFITLLRGIRRTGKSVLARKLMLKTIEETKLPKSAAWFEFDRAMNAAPDDLDEIISFFEENGAQTIVLDEIAFVARWQDVLKRHYDRTNLKFIATGSSALEMDKRTSESLAGRFETIRVKPFSFKERLVRIGKPCSESALELARRSEELRQECEEYLCAGGLPEIAGEKNAENRAKYVNSSVLDPLFYKDLPAVFPNANPDLLRKTLELLSATVGSTFQLQNLAQVLGCSHPTVATQLEILERSLLVSTSYNKTASVMKQKRTAKKIVFNDNGVLRALRPDTPIPALAENAVASDLEATLFWKNPEGREIDAILPKKKLAIEVKYQEHVTGADEKNLEFFLEKNKGWNGILVTKKDDDAKSDIPRLPLWKLLLNPQKIART